MQNQFSFENLFVYDLANNHQGDPQHAANIIREVGRVNKAAGARGALRRTRRAEIPVSPARNLHPSGFQEPHRP
jgi:hypothetical protein